MTSAEALAQSLAETHGRAFAGQGRGWRGAEFSDLLDQPFVELCGDAQGFALIRVVAGEAELLTIAVDPDAQGQGRGRAVLRACLGAAEARGAVAMFLEVGADNAVALALYGTEGFAEAGRRAGYYRHGDGPPQDAVLMRRDLP